MASNQCAKCGARFDVAGAVGTLDTHMASFHPEEASKSQLEKEQKLHEERQAAFAAGAGGSGAGGTNEPLTGEGNQGGGPSPTEPPTDKPLDQLTKPQLVELAELENVDVSEAKTNAERIELIEKARAGKQS